MLDLGTGSTRLEAAGAVDVTAGADASLLADGDVTGYTTGAAFSLGAERVVGLRTAGADGLVGGDGKLVVGGAVSLEAGGAGTATFGDGLTVRGGQDVGERQAGRQCRVG